MEDKRNKVVIVCDSYKGCLTSREVNEAVAEGLRRVTASENHEMSEEYANSEYRAMSEDCAMGVVQIEMSDGGEGMLDAFLNAMGGERVRFVAHDALMRSVEVEYGLMGDTAIVETAQAVGIARIEPEQRNPMRTTTYGVGEILMHAYRHGARRFVVGLGGSATSDCGIGMLRAMGDDWKKLRADCSFTLASDVINPLCGTDGAAHVFAPQKGADAAMVEALDGRAQRFADACARHFGYDRSILPGAGAAGGLGYAFMQFFDANQQAGADMLLNLVGFDRLLRDARLVMTGEGHSDRQTLMGKLPMRVLHRAQRVGVSVWLVSGAVDSPSAMLAAGFSRVVAVTPQGLPLTEAMKADVAKRNIADAVVNIKGANLKCIY